MRNDLTLHSHSFYLSSLACLCLPCMNSHMLKNLHIRWKWQTVLQTVCMCMGVWFFPGKVLFLNFYSGSWICWVSCPIFKCCLSVTQIFTNWTEIKLHFCLLQHKHLLCKSRILCSSNTCHYLTNEGEEGPAWFHDETPIVLHECDS